MINKRPILIQLLDENQVYGKKKDFCSSRQATRRNDALPIGNACGRARSCVDAAPVTIDHIGTLFERVRQPAKCRIKYASHQQRKRPACKLVTQIKSDLTAVRGAGLKGPFDTQSTQWTVARFDKNATIDTVKRNAGSEGLTKNRVGDRHLGHHDLARSLCLASTDDIAQAERYELRVALHVRHEIEHLVYAVVNLPLRLENRHPCVSPCADAGKAWLRDWNVKKRGGPAALIQVNLLPGSQALRLLCD
jgi:hypothetical protein